MSPPPQSAISSTLRSPRRTQERSIETRLRLVVCAIDCICELGYAGATTPVIADRARVSRGALQYHFASRADLDLAVIDHVMTELNFRVDAHALALLPLEDRVEKLIETYWRSFTGPLFRAALNIWLGVINDPPVARRLQDHLSGRQDRIDHAWLTLFKDTGRTRDELTTIRHVVMGTVRGYAVERFFHPSATGQRERALLRELTLSALRQPELHEKKTSRRRA